MENQPVKKEEKKSSNRILLIIIFLLLGICGWMGWQLTQMKDNIVYITQENENLFTEKTALDEELAHMLGQYDSLETNNAQYQQEIETQKEQIMELMKQAEKHKNDAYIISKLKKEATTLRSIMKGYIHTIDSLNTLNITLKAENKEVRGELTTQKEKFSSLEKVKEGLADKVKVGSRLQANDVLALAQRVKSNNVHRETNKADKTDKIKVCFTLAKNEIAKKGKKYVYLRIITPTAKVLCDSEENKFSFNGQKGEYSVQKEIEYNNEELDVCTYYEVSAPLPEGEYIIEVYSDEADIGRTTLRLD